MASPRHAFPDGPLAASYGRQPPPEEEGRTAVLGGMRGGALVLRHRGRAGVRLFFIFLQRVGSERNQGRCKRRPLQGDRLCRAVPAFLTPASQAALAEVASLQLRGISAFLCAPL